MRRDLRSNVAGFLMGDLVVGRDIRDVLDLVNVRCDMIIDKKAPRPKFRTKSESTGRLTVRFSPADARTSLQR
jgi:hypothetical protein